MREARATWWCARLMPGWPEEVRRREQYSDGDGGGVWRRSGEWPATGRPWEGSTGPDEVWALGGAAQRRVRASRGEQQHAGDVMAGERAQKQWECARTRRA